MRPQVCLFFSAEKWRETGRERETGSGSLAPSYLGGFMELLLQPRDRHHFSGGGSNHRETVCEIFMWKLHGQHGAWDGSEVEPEETAVNPPVRFKVGTVRLLWRKMWWKREPLIAKPNPAGSIFSQRERERGGEEEEEGQRSSNEKMDHTSLFMLALKTHFIFMILFFCPFVHQWCDVLINQDVQLSVYGSWKTFSIQSHAWWDQN